MRLRAELDRHVSEPYQALAIVPTATFEEALRGPEAGIVKLPALVFNGRMNMPSIQPLSYNGYRLPPVDHQSLH
jgi:hypothetical protein